MAVKVGVILSGCGHRDGTEIREAVLTLLALDRAGAEAVCFAPDIPQNRVVDHYRGKVVPGETRNVLVEAARIARSQVADRMPSRLPKRWYRVPTGAPLASAIAATPAARGPPRRSRSRAASRMPSVSCFRGGATI